ncbi:MAG: cell filamentation protein Fic [Bacteroidetes bacterium]|nr:MAG: cell filamentation protein Fic [Bacteroidota bacterium]
MEQSQLIIYQSEDGKVRIETRMEGETIWLTQKLMADLFQTTPQNITIHLKNIFEEGELDEDSTCKEFLQVQLEGKREVKRTQKYYNLDAILSVGYRIKSHVATRFRQWATARLKEYLVKGFTLNDELLKQAGGGNYFDELLQRIRDIRSSEKVFWRKVLDIYATSIDYEPNHEMSVLFFQTVQNKMHWATHGHTAAEIIYKRVDAGKKNLGLTHFKGNRPTQQETEIAKNYLNEEELNLLNRMVTAYLELAELQALNRRPMYMKDWIARLDDFLTMTGNDILTHAGKISHKKALEKARAEYEKYHHQQLQQPTQAEKDYIRHIEQTAKKLKKKNGK